MYSLPPSQQWPYTESHSFKYGFYSTNPFTPLSPIAGPQPSLQPVPVHELPIWLDSSSHNSNIHHLTHWIRCNPSASWPVGWCNYQRIPAPLDTKTHWDPFLFGLPWMQHAFQKTNIDSICNTHASAALCGLHLRLEWYAQSQWSCRGH